MLNRGNARAEIFADEADYRAFEVLLRETGEQLGMRLLAYGVMPNHWSRRAGILWPRDDGDLARYMQRLTTTHVRRWHLHATVYRQPPINFPACSASARNRSV